MIGDTPAPSRRHFVFAFAIILVGLAGRAAIDKLLALSGGAGLVAQWAQVQSLIDMVLGAVGIGLGLGLGQGVTVLVAQQAGAPGRHAVLKSALPLGAAIGLAVGLLLFFVLQSGAAGSAWPHGASLAALALAAGASGIAAALLNACWLGSHRQDRVLWLTAGLMLPPVLVAGLGASASGALFSIVAAQLLAGLLVSAAVVFWMLRQSAMPQHGAGDQAGPSGRDGPGRALWRFVPVGISIGLASPISQILVRGEVSAALSWHDAGVIQAIWRSSEWVTALMAGLLSLVYLPRFSALLASPLANQKASREAFLGRIGKVALGVSGATATLLLLLWFNQQAVLAALYAPGVQAGDAAVGLFYLGDGLRVGSWVILFALLALRATWWVTLGEFLSLPLFAGLVIVFAEGLTLERAGMLYVLTYAVYLAFNLAGLATALRQR